MTGSPFPALHELPPLSPSCLSFFMDDFPGGPPPPKVGPLQSTESPEAFRRLTPMSLYGSPGTAHTPESIAHLSPIPEHIWAPRGSTSTTIPTNNFSSRQYVPSTACHDAHGQYTELLPANTDYPILGEGWAPQSPCDPLLIPTTFSPTSSVSALSPSYTTLTPSTPHLVASFLGTGHVSGQHPIPSVPEEPSSHVGHGWQLGAPSSSSGASLWPVQQSSDPTRKSATRTGPVSPSGIEVWQSLTGAAATTIRRRSTSRSPLNDSSTANNNSSPQHSKNTLSRRSPKHRARRTSDDNLLGLGVRRQWAKGLGSAGRGNRCSAVAMEEEEAHNISRESVVEFECVNKSKSEVNSVNTNLDDISQKDQRHEDYQVPSGE